MQATLGGIGCRRPSRTLDHLFDTPRAGVGSWPTPIETIERAGMPAVLVKRDDQSGWGRGGAKARKIDHLIGHLLAGGYDELVMVVGNITNLAFDILPALDAAGVRASIFILDDPPTPRAAREVIFRGVRDRVTLLGPSRAEAALALAKRWALARQEGRRPFVALPGVSHPSGVIGNARGFIEMAMQRERERRPLPETVFVTAATGTTVAGFLLGEHALREAGHRPVRIVGVQVYPGAMKSSVRGLLRWTEHHLGLGTHVPMDRVDVVTDELHGGFGRFSRSMADTCDALADDTGLRIDPIFGGKTWRAMQTFLSRERARAESVLYWHCGYTPEWRSVGRLS